MLSAGRDVATRSLRRELAAEQSAVSEAFSDALSNASPATGTDPWQAMFQAAERARPAGETDLFPYWISPAGDAKIQRHVPNIPHSREVLRQLDLQRSLVLYRMVFGQNRQEDLVAYLRAQVDESHIEDVVAQCRIDLSPPRPAPRSNGGYENMGIPKSASV